jgi:hypothetical protein
MSKIPKHYYSFVNVCNCLQTGIDHFSSSMYNTLVMSILSRKRVEQIGEIDACLSMSCVYTNVGDNQKKEK